MADCRLGGRASGAAAAFTEELCEQLATIASWRGALLATGAISRHVNAVE